MNAAILLILALLAPLAARATPDNATPDNAAVAEGFIGLAFGGPAGADVPAIWREPTIRIGLVGQPGRAFKPQPAMAVLTRRLAALTGLDLQPAEGRAADIVLVFVAEPARDLLGPEHGWAAEGIFPDRDEREREIAKRRGADCAAWFAHAPGPPARMTRVLGAVRRAQNADSQWACMVDLMVRAMGFREHRLDADWTMLGAQAPWREPTEADALMLRLLYAPDLATEEEPDLARATARALLDRWRPEPAAPR